MKKEKKHGGLRDIGSSPGNAGVTWTDDASTVLKSRIRRFMQRTMLWPDASEQRPTYGPYVRTFSLGGPLAEIYLVQSCSQD